MSAYGYYESDDSYGYGYGDGGYTDYGGPFLQAYGSVGHPGYASDTTSSGVHRTAYFSAGDDGAYYRHAENSSPGYYAQTTRYFSGYGLYGDNLADTSYYRSYPAGANTYDGGDVQSYYKDASLDFFARGNESASVGSYSSFTVYADGSSYFLKDYEATENPGADGQSHGYDVTARTDSYGYTTYGERSF